MDTETRFALDQAAKREALLQRDLAAALSALDEVKTDQGKLIQKLIDERARHADEIAEWIKRVDAALASIKRVEAAHRAEMLAVDKQAMDALTSHKTAIGFRNQAQDQLASLQHRLAVREADLAAAERRIQELLHERNL